MSSSIPIFPIIMLIIWIVTSLVKKKAGVVNREESQSEEKEHNKPEETIERFFRKITGEEEIKIAPPPPFKPLTETVNTAPATYYQPKMEETTFKVTPAIKKGKKKEVPVPLLGKLDIPSVRRGIVLAEVLGPPRSEKPL